MTHRRYKDALERIAGGAGNPQAIAQEALLQLSIKKIGAESGVSMRDA